MTSPAIFRTTLMFVLLTVTALLAAAPPADAKPAILTPEQAIAVRRPADLQFSPDGKRLAFSVSRPPKGTTQGQEIWMLDVGTRRLWRFTHSPKSDRTPRWSPDGSQLAFVSDRGERAQVYLMPTDGGEAEVLTDSQTPVTVFEWSPDGKSVAFLAAEPKTDAEKKKDTDKDDARVVDGDDKPTRLWVIEVAGKKARKLGEGRATVESLQWAPAGDR